MTACAHRRRARAASIGSALLCAAAFGAPPSASADPDAERRAADERVASLHEALEGTSTELATAYLALQQTQAQLPAAEAALADATAKAKAAQARNAEVATQLALASANEARAADAVARNTAELESVQRTLDAFAADMFQGGKDSQLSVALGATSPDDFATRLELADTVSSATNETLRTLAAVRADAQAQRAYLTAVRGEVEQLARQAEAALQAASSAQAAAQSAKISLDTLVAQRAAYTGAVESRKAAEMRQLNAAEADRAQLQARLAQQARQARQAQQAAQRSAAAAGKPYVAPNAGTNKTASNYLDHPAAGPITSVFGERFHPILQVSKLHTGTDFAVACGTPVHATASGTVVSAGPAGGNGNQVMVDHGIQRGVDLVTTYNHLSSIVVSRGPVQRGQLLGYSGNTGYSTGCHLHFETLEDGRFVDPRTWI